MKINPTLLFETSGLSCIKIIPGEDGAVAGRYPALAAFVTEESVRMSRNADPAARHDEAHFPDVRYGDLLVRWIDEKGARQGMRAAAGMDAGIHLVLGEGTEARDLPFSGIAMLAARGVLSGRGSSSEDHRRALAGISGVFQAILADPDVDRFSPELIGMSFLAHMAGQGQRLQLSVPVESFGRKARADLLRSRIGMIDPSHPDSRGASPNLREIVGRFLPAQALASARLSGQAVVDEDMLRRTIASDPDLKASVYRAATTVPESHVDAMTIPADQVGDLLNGLAHHRLTGFWVDTLETNLRRISRSRNSGDTATLSFFAREGRDIMLLGEEEGTSLAPAYAFSWPSRERALVQAGSLHVNVSREEVPSEAEIARLRTVLGELTRGAEHESGLDFLESLSRSGE